MTLALLPDDDARRHHRCDACNVGRAIGYHPVTLGVYCSETCERRHTPPLTPAFSALVKTCLSVGQPTHYRRDLTLWDRLECSHMDPGEEFVYVVRDYGTHIIRASTESATMIRCIGRTFGGVVGYWHWDGRRIGSTTYESAAARCDRWQSEARKAAKAAA